MPTHVILLEKIEKLGNMGDVVSVKPGYARNYLLPQSKALRATKDNIAYFETQKAALQKQNDEKKKVAQGAAKAIDGTMIVVIRQASEGGQLYGSVTSRDIAEGITQASGQDVARSMVVLNQSFKTIGIFSVEVTLHPEVKVPVKVNIARSAEEAKIQEKTGKAVIAEEADAAARATAQAERDAREGLMDDEALQAQKAQEAVEAEDAAKEAAKAEKKSKARKDKKAAKAVEETAEASAPEEAQGEESAE